MTSKAKVFLVVLSVLFFVAYAVIFIFTPDIVNSLTLEDHLYENQQAICDLGVSIVFFYLFLKVKEGNDFHFIKTRRNIFFLLLALLFFFGFGEEISWGQRIFHWQTPAWMAKANVQDETDLHNLEIFNYENFQGQRKSFWADMLDFNRIYSFFWFSFCFAIPLLCLLFKRFSNWMQRLKFPVIPLWMGVLFPLNYLVSKIIQSYFMNNSWKYFSEVKESVFALLFAGLSLWILSESHKLILPT